MAAMAMSEFRHMTTYFFLFYTRLLESLSYIPRTVDVDFRQAKYFHR